MAIFHFIHPATRALFREGRKIAGYGLSSSIHGYIYGRWIYLYISLGKGDHFLARIFSSLFKRWSLIFPRPESSSPNPLPGTEQPTNTSADGYHGKVVTTSLARRLVTLDRPINIPDLEQVIPYVRARALILDHPDHLAVLDCPCRSAQVEHCQPLAVCLVIGEPFVEFMLAHHPKKCRRISQTEATDILTAEARRGHVHHAFFKDASLGRFYAICNCCACCCGAIKAHKRGPPMLAHSGYVSQVDQALCAGCGVCARNCQFEAISLLEGVAQVDHELCMGCGVCAGSCAKKAISLEQDGRRGLPLDIYNWLPTDN